MQRHSHFVPGADSPSGRIASSAVRSAALINKETDDANFPWRAWQDPSRPKGRVHNFIANKELGTLSDIHENVISPGVTVPWHFHETEEVIVVLEGDGECRSDQGTEAYSAGDVIILPPRMKHSLCNSGDKLIRQICFFPGDPATTFLEGDYPGQTVDVFNPSEWGKPTSSTST